MKTKVKFNWICLKFKSWWYVILKENGFPKFFFQSQLLLILWLKHNKFNWTTKASRKKSIDIHMPHANTNLFLNRLFVYSLKSWSVFWVKVQTTTISHWQINTENMKKKQETEMLTSWALPFWPEIKSHTKKRIIRQDHFLLSKSIWKNSEERKMGRGDQNKTRDCWKPS